MTRRRIGTLLAAGIRGASLLISSLALATEGTSAGGGAAGVRQQTKPHTGKKHRAKGRSAGRKSKPEGSGAVSGAEETTGVNAEPRGEGTAPDIGQHVTAVLEAVRRRTEAKGITQDLPHMP